MVRHFPNTLEDYRPGVAVSFKKDELMTQIEEHVQSILKRLRPSSRTVDGGLYVGVTGVAFMFYRLSKNTLLTEKKQFYQEKALEYIKPALESSAGEKTSFLLGDAGTYAIAAVLKKETGDIFYTDQLTSYTSLCNLYLNSKFLKCGGDELFVGRAGYIAGALWLSRELQKAVVPIQDLHRICDAIITSGREYSKKHGRTCPLMYHYYNTEYIGAAHGISFILQILLSVPDYLESNQSAASDVKESIELLLSLQTEEGNWPCCMEEVGLEEHKLVHWCHGAPGIVYLMAKAFMVYKEETYLNACIKAGELVWSKGLLRKGPGICHGVAGSGYVFLLLYRLTKDNKYLYRAKVFGDFMNSDEFLREARVPDNPETLFEGAAGTVCYLSDLLLPDVAEFPFCEIFPA